MTAQLAVQDKIRSKNVEKLLLEIFGGNPYYAKCIVSDADMYYKPVELALEYENIKEHTKGKVILGSYQLMQGIDAVKWFGWDVDSSDILKARKLVEQITKYLEHVPYAVEYSGGKGYHVLVFLKEPLPAVDAKKIVDWVRESEGLQKRGSTHVECFPKQDRLTRSRPKGNLLKIPLGVHPRSHAQSIFVDMLNGWETGPILEPCDILSYKASAEDVLAIIESGPDLETQLVELISAYWRDGVRHDLSLFLSGYLAHEGWGVDQTKELIRKIVTRSDDDELRNRLQTVQTTFSRHKEGKSVRGRQGLGEILPVSAMQKLSELVSLIRAPDTVAQIDDIRYSRGRPKLESARLAASVIWTILHDSGCKIFQNKENLAYWYDSETHTVIDEGSEQWDSLLNKIFGLNPIENFSKLTATELRLRIIRDAPIIPILHRTFWSESAKKLYVNLGGPEVYIISGEGKIDKSYNGECGYMFITNISGEYVIPDFDTQRVDTWDHLVNDLSFTTSSEAPATPDEQKELLKAWLLAYFFQEMLPTKPILAMLGIQGSGKTTAIRRILRILEEPDSDVLSIPTDKQDALRASISSHRLLALDNLEKSGVWWLVDLLNKLSTGSHIELRKLYHTNRKYTIVPQCFVAITAVNMPFSDETLFTRLLVLEMTKLTTPLPEYVLQRKIREYGPAIWADLLIKLSSVVEILKDDPMVLPPTKSRLVDFTVFCEKIKKSKIIHAKNLSGGLLSMVDSQMKQLKESSQAIFLLEEWLTLKPQEASEWKTFPQLFDILQTMSQARRQTFKWKSSQGLYRHFSTLKERLCDDFQAEFKDEFDPHKRKEVLKIRFNVMLQ
ncbi:hypothetical protein LCGC14_0466330 [marine sediment metagenome]|uniref:TOTE conflict system primase domain-containing protein n=1 Tax=marine sediment metagenome TaxID=412755 RepID=A0A0F9VME7_9ZZZZ